eukprot:CAMPEP_0115852694 /NCGR_PEP_ID=MMETSP0287-20121206/13127_1 /TAXON_ID=412157 /ORGANISM="Chrysochromulina rotalis, Strain UIO044" /LENGTH=207 /DNA_ID=CAMNT_0003306761 /DNA_START=703 /DNA_END=1327 /DNA_ORIENTATION=-
MRSASRWAGESRGLAGAARWQADGGRWQADSSLVPWRGRGGAMPPRQCRGLCALRHPRKIGPTSMGDLPITQVVTANEVHRSSRPHSLAGGHCRWPASHSQARPRSQPATANPDHAASQPQPRQHAVGGRRVCSMRYTSMLTHLTRVRLERRRRQCRVTGPAAMMQAAQARRQRARGSKCCRRPASFVTHTRVCTAAEVAWYGCTEL